MATVQKTSKINFYKFVQVKEPSSAAVKGDSSAEVAKSINSSTKAINNLGATVNSIVKIMDGLKAVAIGQLEAEKLKSKSFKAQYTTPQKKEKEGGGIALPSLKTPSFLEGLLNILGGLFRVAVITPVLEWLADERNKKQVEDAITAIWRVVKFVADFTKWGVTSVVDGLYNLLKDDASPLERFGGLIQGLTGLGGMMLGIRWLTNPGNIIRDFGGVLRFFHKNLLSSRAGMIRRMGALGLAVGAGVLIYKGVTSFNDMRENDPAIPSPEEVNAAAQQQARGGNVKQPPKRAQGGWINGPQSGYPVSLDGGRSTSFIGHGKEYVARKANGGAFVVPFDTPFTKRNPHLTQKRIGEARSQGFDLPGFAAGGNLNKQIYLHWTAGSYNHKAGPYHATVQGSGKIYRHLPYTARTGHTYNRNSGNVGLSAATMGGQAWVSYPPKEAQIDAMMLEAANIAKKWGWKPSDVNIKRVMTHAEAGSNKDGRRMHDNYGPVMWGGTGERWDWLQLKKTDKPGTGGDKLRQKMKKFMGDPNAKEVPEAGGLSASDAMQGGGTKMTDIPLTLEGTAKDLVGGDGNFLAEVNRVSKALKIHPADLLGLMASESGLDPKAQNKSGATGLIQFMPDTAAGLGTSTGALKNMTRSEQMKYVEKFLKNSLKGVPLKDGKVPAGNLYTAVYLPAFAAKDSSYIVAKKGGFTDDWGNHPAAWYTHNKGLDLNGDGAISIAELGKRIADKKKEFGIKGGTMSIPASSVSTVSPADHEDSNITPSGGNYGNSILGKVSPTAGMFGEDVYGRHRVGSRSQASGGRSGGNNQAGPSGGASNVNRAGGANTGATVGSGPGSTISPSERRERAQLQEATQQRNMARQMMNQKSQEMISTALDAVGKQNGANAQVIALAQQTIAQIMSQSQAPAQPQFIPTGGTGGGGGISASGIGRAIGGNVGAAVGGATAAVLNSTNNPLRGIFR